MMVQNYTIHGKETLRHSICATFTMSEANGGDDGPLLDRAGKEKKMSHNGSMTKQYNLNNVFQWT